MSKKIHIIASIIALIGLIICKGCEVAASNWDHNKELYESWERQRIECESKGGAFASVYKSFMTFPESASRKTECLAKIPLDKP